MKYQDSRRGSEWFHHEGHEGVKGTTHRSTPTILGPVPGAPQSYTQSPDSIPHRILFFVSFVLFVVNPLRPPVLLRNRHPSRTAEIRSHYTIETTRNLFFLSPVRCTHSSRKDRQGILVLTLRVSVSPPSRVWLCRYGKQVLYAVRPSVS